MISARATLVVARDMLPQGKVVRPCRTAVVDEMQDVGAEALELVREVVPEGADDLMLVGDAYQRIYGR